MDIEIVKVSKVCTIEIHSNQYGKYKKINHELLVNYAHTPTPTSQP
jgi:hypothetical protein